MKTKPIIFVQPPASYGNANPCLDDKQFGLGILANVAWLKQHGYVVSAIHIPLMLHAGGNPDAILKNIIAQSPLLVAIGLNWVHFSKGAIATAQKLRALSPHLPIYIGGQHAGLFADEIATAFPDAISGVIRGEAEVPLLQIADQLSAGNAPPTDIPGLHTANRHAKAPCVIADIDQLPPYRYGAMRPAPLKADVGAVSTTRGPCPFRCAWCIEPVVGRMQGRSKLQFHSAGRIADQIESLRAEGINRFTIQDNFFIGGDKNLIGLADALARRDLRPEHLNIFAHPDSFSAAGISALASCAELGSIDYGIETGSVRVAHFNNRHFHPGKPLTASPMRSASGLNPIPGGWPVCRAKTKQACLKPNN